MIRTIIVFLLSMIIGFLLLGIVSGQESLELSWCDACKVGKGEEITCNGVKIFGRTLMTLSCAPKE